jgi:hypothetical protein
MAPTSHSVWRLSLLWQGSVLDQVSVKGRKGSIALRTGEKLKVRVVDDDGVERLEILGDRLLVVLSPGQFCALPAGHVLHADVDVAAARIASPLSVDSTLLHSTMIGVALQVCVVSALWLAPLDTPSEAGAGVATDARRWLSIPGGTAPRAGRATFSATGRKPEEAERAVPAKKKGAPLPQRPGKGPSLDQTLEAMKRALHPGDGGDLRESLGELSRAFARAPVLGNGNGGLSPRDPVDTGPGSGVVGAGTTVALDDLLRRRVSEADKKLAAAARPPRPVFPVTMTEVPDAAVDSTRMDADPELDPVVRDHLSRMIRSRHNVIRGCYESWGLSADAHRAGRLVLELTLRPDGHVENLKAETSTSELRMVGDCVVRAASEWYLGDGLVLAPTRLAFPFVLQPRG